MVSFIPWLLFFVWLFARRAPPVPAPPTATLEGVFDIPDEELEERDDTLAEEVDRREYHGVDSEVVIKQLMDKLFEDRNMFVKVNFGYSLVNTEGEITESRPSPGWKTFSNRTLDELQDRLEGSADGRRVLLQGKVVFCRVKLKNVKRSKEIGGI